MRNGAAVPSRTFAEKAVLWVAALCAVVAVGRFGAVVAVVPYAAYLNQRDAAAPSPSSNASTPTPLLERIAKSRPFTSWWGGRRIPRPAGGDYLEVIANSSIARSLGCVLGVMSQRSVASGIKMDRILVPADLETLYGREPGSLMTLEDGSNVRTSWGSLARDASRFSDVPVVTKAYPPLLTVGQATGMDAAGLKERSKSFFVGTPVAGGSGTWILLSRQGARREFLLIPLEVSPVGGAL